MARIRSDDQPAAENLTPRERARVFGAGRRKHRCTFDSLEARALFAGDLAGALTNGLPTPAKLDAHMQPFDVVPKIQADEAVATSRVLGGGDVTVTFADGSSKVYQKVENGWMLINWDHQTPQGWTEDSWGADRTFVENIWTQKQHGAAGSADQTVSLKPRIKPASRCLLSVRVVGVLSRLARVLTACQPRLLGLYWQD